MARAWAEPSVNEVIQEAKLELRARRGMLAVTTKFCRHREGCHCFICRTLTDRERAILRAALETDWSQPE